jgi:type IV secretory pathway VirB10-like protein
MASHHPVLPNITDPSMVPIIADDIEQLHKSEQENLSFFQNHKFAIIVAVVIIVVLAVVLYMYMTRDDTPTEKKPQTIDSENKALNDIVALRNMRKLKRVQNQSLPQPMQPMQPMQPQSKKQGKMENKEEQEQEQEQEQVQVQEQAQEQVQEQAQEQEQAQAQEQEQEQAQEQAHITMLSNKPDNLEIDDGGDDIDALLRGLADQ